MKNSHRKIEHRLFHIIQMNLMLCKYDKLSINKRTAFTKKTNFNLLN